MSETIMALYDTLEDGNDAVSDLVSEGFNRSDIGLVVNNGEGLYDVNSHDMDAAEGAGLGAVAGGITGLVVGLTAIAIPGIGPIVAAGPLAVALSAAAGAGVGAAAGAVTGGLAASLIDLGVPESQVDFYGEAIRRGSTMVSVIAEETRVTEAMRILNRHNPYDVEHRARQWSQDGWKGYASSSEASESMTTSESHARRYNPETPR